MEWAAEIDTHLHTTLSFDAGAAGGSELEPKEAYRFAKGEEVATSSNQAAKLSRPLDFLVVADHSDNMGMRPRPPRGKTEHPRKPDRTPLVRIWSSRGKAQKPRGTLSTPSRRENFPKRRIFNQANRPTGRYGKTS